MKIVTVVGARPQFIKAAVVSRAIAQERHRVRQLVVHTGQHFDANMSTLFFDELDLPKPDYNLGIGGGTHGQNTGRMLEALEQVLVDQGPDWVLVYGDTDSTLAGTLAAVKLHIPVAHVEAGLRCFDRTVPEEINRIATDHLSELALSPTATATRNLQNEGISGKRVAEVGDVMYDATLYYTEKAEQVCTLMQRMGLSSKSFILATIHRPKNADSRENMECILAGLAEAPLPVVLPLHPRTRKRLESFGLAIPPSIRIIDPVGYLDMQVLERHASLIVTDSGGVQKEAYFHRVPCVTLKNDTEWVETVESGANVLVGVDSALIAENLKARPNVRNFPAGLYGDGCAGEQVVAQILSRDRRCV